MGIINRIWAKVVLALVALPWKAELRTSLDPKRQYIFCPNHFSYIDIPTMGLNPVNAVFVGKSEMEGIPLFGWMYRNLHITVDRTKLKSKYATLIKSLEALDKGKSLIIFPEGGIYTKEPPQMTRFKDGAFRAAIEKQIPLVPVTIPNNWIILPDEEFLLRWGTVHVIFHEPIETKGLTIADLDRLKSEVYKVIDLELKHQLNENRSLVTG